MTIANHAISIGHRIDAKTGKDLGYHVNCSCNDLNEPTENRSDAQFLAFDHLALVTIDTQSRNPTVQGRATKGILTRAVSKSISAPNARLGNGQANTRQV